MKEWKKIFPIEDREIYEAGGFTGDQEPGEKPALLIIDVVESFTGRKGISIEESQKEYPTSCGARAWSAVDNIKKLLNKFREKDLTVIYVKGNPVTRYHCGSATKATQNKAICNKVHSASIVKEIAPGKDEFVLEKTKASAFFCTPLVSCLNRLGIDTLYISGCVTSGCIRASVIDAYSYGYKVFVVEECVFDRSLFSHFVNLYEMNVKYADVITIEDVLRNIE